MWSLRLTSSSPVSFGGLIGEGFEHWLGHQRQFWSIAAAFAVLVALVDFATPATSHGSQSGLIAFFYTYVLCYWFRLTMYDDWKARSATLSKTKETRNSIYRPGFPFVAFCLAYGITAFVIGFIALVSASVNIYDLNGLYLVEVFLLSALSYVVVAILFANILLFLPARAVGLRPHVQDSLRLASGVRMKLLGLALFCTFFSLVGAACIAVLVATHLASEIVVPVVHGIAVLVDLLALYILAYGLGRLFITKSGWQPEPLP